MKKTARLFLGVAVTTIMVFNCAAHAQLNLTNGLVSYYPFNGNAKDAFGTNNGTVYGASLTTNRFGVANSAYSFNGSSSYIDLGSAHQLFFTNNFTLSAWCLFSGGANSPRLISSGWETGYNLFTLYTTSNRLFGVYSYEYSEAPNPFYTASSYSQNTWYAVALVVTNGTGTIFVNGVSAGSGFFNPPLNTDVTIGWDYGSVDYWGGKISNVRFYNRPLSTNEIQLLYQYESANPQLVSATLALQINTTNLVVGGRYQIQTSSNLISWFNYGAPFIATSTNAPQFISVTGSQGYFQILPAP